MADTNKNALRAKLLQRRRALTPERVREGSERIIERLRALREWRNAAEALIYWPVNNEVDLRPLVTELWQRGACVLLPRCRPERNGEMDLACAACEADLTPGPFSIMEPDAGKCPPVQECSPAIALIPGVGFDRAGNRLGFGGGYYDRLLSTEQMRRTLKVGICYGFQVVDGLPADPWDRPMDLICTDDELWRP
ncbi:MAG: 5-formyltetrahydrofolate cyclo-ligase [Desulfovibrionaceae bacterium]|nr:5-formyltetrahydrofolate cyclo-ligase [Desulfovibrionaceae bacterium]